MTDTAVIEKEAVELADEEVRRYELGFHLIPTLSEEEAIAVLNSLKEKITSAGGEILREEAPEKMRLAYSIQKDIDRTRHTYNEAYFGWIHFVSAPSSAHALKESLDGDNQILRFLVIKISEVVTKADEATAAEGDSSDTSEVDTSGDEVTSEEEMDKEIDKLVEGDEMDEE